MPLVNGVGFSDYTETKQEFFNHFLAVHKDIVRAIIKKYDWASPWYHYFDCTAGPGVVNGEWGSPLIAMHQLKSTQTFGVFMEQNDDTYNELLDNLHDNFIKHDGSEFRAFNGDSCELLPGVLSFLKGFSPKLALYGLVYFDPSGNIPPFDFFDAC